jgi:hypothetical protein
VASTYGCQSFSQILQGSAPNRSLFDLKEIPLFGLGMVGMVGGMVSTHDHDQRKSLKEKYFQNGGHGGHGHPSVCMRTRMCGRARRNVNQPYNAP